MEFVAEQHQKYSIVLFAPLPVAILFVHIEIVLLSDASFLKIN